MDKEYICFGPNPHLWVIARDPDKIWKTNEPLQIVLHTEEYVWVYGHGHMEEPESRVVRVTDGRSFGYDEYGECVLSIPAEWCEYLTDDEASGILDCRFIFNHLIYSSIKGIPNG